MTELLLALLQATGGPVPLEDIKFDLRTLPASDRRADDIVVTARRRDERVRPLPEVEESAIPTATTGLLGEARIGVVADQASVGGFTSNRAMVRVKVPF
jgi:hypothetical protein